MIAARHALATITLSLASMMAQAGGLAPWTFGMSPAQVRALATFGPYKSFSNGDLETYNGDFAGKKRNVQFYFRDDALRRIAVRMYEGTDIDQASAAWVETLAALEKTYGKVDVPFLRGSAENDFARKSRDVVTAGDKAQMAPSAQPAGEFVFGSFYAKPFLNAPFYTVTVNFDPPRSPATALRSSP